MRLIVSPKNESRRNTLPASVASQSLAKVAIAIQQTDSDQGSPRSLADLD